MPLRFPFHGLVKPHLLPPALRGFYLSYMLSQTADALLLIAGPAFMYRWGEQLWFLQQLPLSSFQRGMLAVIGFFALSRVVYLCLLAPLSPLLGKLGFNRSMILGLVITFSTYLLFPSVSTHQWLFFVLPVTRAFAIFFYWVSFHLYFASEIRISEVGKDVGALEFLSKLMMLLAPLLGTFLATEFGYTSSFLASVALYILATILLLFIPNLHTRQVWSWGALKEALKNSQYRIAAVGLMAWNWESTGITLFWPLFLLLAFHNLRTVGYILTAASLISLLFVYLTGWTFDHRKKNSLFPKIIGGCLACLWIPRLFFAHLPIVLVATDALDRVFAGIFNTFFSATMVWRSRQEKIFVYYFNFEALLSLTLLGGYGLAIALLLTHWNWIILFATFLIAGLLSLFFHFPKSGEKRSA